MKGQPAVCKASLHIEGTVPIGIPIKLTQLPPSQCSPLAACVLLSLCPAITMHAT